MNREEQIKKAQELLSDGKFVEARSLVEAIKKHDAEKEKEPEKIIEECNKNIPILQEIQVAILQITQPVMQTEM